MTLEQGFAIAKEGLQFFVVAWLLLVFIPKEQTKSANAIDAMKVEQVKSHELNREATGKLTAEIASLTQQIIELRHERGSK